MAAEKGSCYGRRLMPQILDDLAASHPDRIVFSIAAFGEDSHHFRRISAGALARAVDNTARWLQSLVGRSTTIRTCGYIGPHDLRHVLLTYACVKVNCTALFLSPKNNIEGALAVLDATDCCIWISPIEQKYLPLVEGFLQQRCMNVLELPTLDELLDAEATERPPFDKTFDNAVNEPFCILHTSGTTGVPKPISWTHGLIGTMDAVRLLPPTEGDGGLAPWTSIWNSGDTIYSSFPMSHGAGIIMDILMPALYDLHCVLGPASVLPNMNLIESLAEHANIDIWSMVPSLVDELGETPDVLAKFTASKFICASGGPVSPIIAAKVNDVIRVLNLTGTTEGLFIGNLIVDREDWLWFAFHPWSGFEFKEVEPGSFEHWVHRNQHWEHFQGLFYTFPDKQSVNLKDLYIKHPSKPNLWGFKGRTDDVVVLSNGYKVSPLDTEAYVTTHPAIDACLVIGTGKPQAGLLIELKDPSARDNDLFDSIWATVQKAAEFSMLKYRIDRDYITFAEPDKPFIRTDKGTVKRRATITLYAEYIDRLYDSRDETANNITIDTTSLEAIMDSLRSFLATMLPAINKASPDTDIFTLGLDSLNVFKVVNSIKATMDLSNKLAPRHLYANPTLIKFSTLLSKLASEARRPIRKTLRDPDESDRDRLRTMIERHKQRQSFKLNPMDQVNPNHYMGLNFYLPLRSGTTFQAVFSTLQQGLQRTFDLLPALDGKMMHCSEQESGYKKGDCQVNIPPMPQMFSKPSIPRQLTFKDHSENLPSFEQLRQAGFITSMARDNVLLPDNTFPDYPADILVAQANFVEGGCILSTNFHHSCLDGVGVMVAMKVWAESCTFVDGDSSATCEWLEPESFNHSLPQILYEQEGYAKPVEQVDPGTWSFISFLPDEDDAKEHANSLSITHGSYVKTLPPKPLFPEQLLWPPPEDPAGRCLRTTMFLVSAKNIQTLKQEVLADPNTNGALSLSDIIQAFFWRAAIRARYKVARLRGQTFAPDDQAILELPIDGRPYFSALLPSTYMGSMLIMNRPHMPIEMLCSPSTSIGQIAQILREAAARITPSLVHDCYTLLQSLPSYDRFTLANMGLDSMHAMISNLMLFQPGEISFGESMFADGGSPEALRPQIERRNRRFRFLVIYPLRKDGGVELVLGTLPDELEMLKNDDEFIKYATLLDS